SPVLHFYFTKRLVGPTKQLIEATEISKKGANPKTIQTTPKNEVGELVTHSNELINQLEISHAKHETLLTTHSHQLRISGANLQRYLYALKTRTIEGDSELFESLYLEANRLTSMIEQIDQINDLNSIKFDTDKQLTEISIDHVISSTLKMFEL